MKCTSCKKKSNFQHEKRNYCRSCYCKLIERRIGKYLRTNSPIKKDDILFIKEPLLEFIIKKIVKGMPFKIVKRKTKISKEVSLWTLDDEVAFFIDRFFSKNFKMKIRKGLSPLRPITDKEAQLYAKFKKLKFIPNKKPDSYKLLKSLEKKYPELFFSISRSIKELEKVFR
ncbi:MAG: hypothetical protein U9R08_05885 [Nanoarchaeota archaeon]|nr:hypothetical protein [Nanoarchaeota archaeon]